MLTLQLPGPIILSSRDLHRLFRLGSILAPSLRRGIRYQAQAPVSYMGSWVWVDEYFYAPSRRQGGEHRHNVCPERRIHVRRASRTSTLTALVAELMEPS